MSTQTTNYGLVKPDVTEFYDITIQNSNMDKIDEELKKSADHITNKSNPHSTTASQVGLGNVPNVATNDQTPTYTAASSNTALVSGEKLSVAFGKIAKAVSSLISHLGDTVGHITSAERTKWNNKLDSTAKATDSDKLDGLDSTAFMLCSTQYGYNTFLTNDLNEWIKNGSYGTSSDCTPIPSGTDGWGSIIVSNTVGNKILQVAWFWNETGNPLWRRIRNSDGATWGEWQKIADTRNTALVKIQSTAPTDTTALWVY